MMMPNFVRLAQLDDQHFVTACRHGLIHLTWGRVTARLTREEFRQLVGMLQQAQATLSPASLRQGDLRITTRPDEECELQIGKLVLLLSPDQFEGLARIAQEALHRLDRILASGAWDKEEPAQAPPGFLEQFRRVPFSRN
jgi:hypothetical protein